MKVIILAGGFATRLWPLTEHNAKPLLPIAGKPIISHLVEKLSDEHEVIISTNKVFEAAFLKWRNSFPHKKIEIFVEDSGSEDFKKGALGATALVIQEKHIQEDLMLLTGDNIFGFELEDFIKEFRDSPILAVYDVKDLEEAKKYGVVVTKGDKVSEFQEKPAEPKSTLASTGCYIFPKSCLGDIVSYAKEKKDDLGGIFEYFMEQGRDVHYYAFDEYWYDIGSFSAYIAAHKDLQNKVIKEANVYEMGNTQCNGAVWIDHDSVIEDSTIEDSIILEGARIHNCSIRNCIVDEGCELSNVDLQWKIVRKGTVIEG